MNNRGTNEHSVTVVLPKYELISTKGPTGLTFDTVQAAATFAADAWPGQEQDPDRTGKGWDIAVVGAE